MRPQPVKAFRKIVNHWLDLSIKRFSCGHEKTAANTLIARYGNKQACRCRKCHNAKSAAYRNRRKH